MTLKFEISFDEANLVVHALRKLPMELSEDLVAKLRAQANAQAEQEKASEKEVKLEKATEAAK